jgi:hypothetical protein
MIERSMDQYATMHSDRGNDLFDLWIDDRAARAVASIGSWRYCTKASRKEKYARSFTTAIASHACGSYASHLCLG